MNNKIIVRVAEGLVNHGHEEAVGMIMLYCSSSIKKGISKKNNQPYSFLSVKLLY